MPTRDLTLIAGSSSVPPSERVSEKLVPTAEAGGEALDRFGGVEGLSNALAGAAWDKAYAAMRSAIEDYEGKPETVDWTAGGACEISVLAHWNKHGRPGAEGGMFDAGRFAVEIDRLGVIINPVIQAIEAFGQLDDVVLAELNPVIIIIHRQHPRCVRQAEPPDQFFAGILM